MMMTLTRSCFLIEYRKTPSLGILIVGKCVRYLLVKAVTKLFELVHCHCQNHIPVPTEASYLMYADRLLQEVVFQFQWMVAEIVYDC